MKRREFIGKTLAAGAGLSMIFAKKEQQVRVGYLPITDAAPLLVAHANGYYKEEGLDVPFPSLIRNWSSLVEAFLSGKFDVVHLLLPIPIWMRYRNKQPVKIVAWDHLNGSALTVRGGEGLNSFADLKQKNIAVPYWYSMHNVLLQMGLRQAGLKPVIQSQTEKLEKNEVNLVLLPPPEMPSALSAKKIDGFIVAEPFNALAEQKLRARIMRFTGDMWHNHPCCVVVMKESLITSQPVLTQKIINALVRAQLWMMQNPRETATILSHEGKGYLPVPKETLLRVFTQYSQEEYCGTGIPCAIRHPEWKSRRISFQPYPYPSATRFIIDRLKQTVVQGDNRFLSSLNSDFAVKDLVAETFVKKSIQLAGGPNLFPDVNVGAPWEREEIIDI